MADNLDVAAIRARLAKATPRPWRVIDNCLVVKQPRQEGHGHDPKDVLAVCSGVQWPSLEERARSDADFIAHAREDVPALLAGLNGARTLVRRLIEARHDNAWAASAAWDEARAAVEGWGDADRG